MSDADRFGRERSCRRRRSPSSTTTTSRSRSGSRPGHGGSTHRHARYRARHHRSSYRHEKKVYHHEMSVKDRDGRDDHDDRSLTAKRLKRVNVEDPLSAFPSKTKTKSGHIPASEFTKSQWNSFRRMDPVSGKFLVKNMPGHDDWIKMAKSGRLITKWSGDPAFADTRLVVGHLSVIAKAMT